MVDPVTKRVTKKVTRPATEKTLNQLLGPERARQVAPIVAPIVAQMVARRLYRMRQLRRVQYLDRKSVKRTARADADPNRRNVRRANKTKKTLARAERHLLTRKQRRQLRRARAS